MPKYRQTNIIRAAYKYLIHTRRQKRLSAESMYENEKNLYRTFSCPNFKPDSRIFRPLHSEYDNFPVPVFRYENLLLIKSAACINKPSV